jgi:hypothetical protein
MYTQEQVDALNDYEYLKDELLAHVMGYIGAPECGGYTLQEAYEALDGARTVIAGMIFQQGIQ